MTGHICEMCSFQEALDFVFDSFLKVLECVFDYVCFKTELISGLSTYHDPLDASCPLENISFAIAHMKSTSVQLQCSHPISQMSLFRKDTDELSVI